MHLGDPQPVACVAVRLRRGGNLEVVLVVAAVRLDLAQVPWQARAAQDRSGDAEREAPVQREVADALEALAPDRLTGEELVVVRQPRAHHGDEVGDLLGPALGEVLREAAGADEGVVHAQAGEELEQVQHLLALSEAGRHARQRAELHATGREAHQVRADPVELHEQYPCHLRTARHLDPEQLLDAHAVRGLVEQRREVVHARHERDALGPGAVLAVLLDPGVQVADHRAGLGDGLALQLQHQPQHAVGGRVLRAHVDDDAVVVLGELGAVEERVPVPAGDGVDRALGGDALFRRPCILADLRHEWARLWSCRSRDLHAPALLMSTTASGQGEVSARPCTRRGSRRAGSPCAAGGRPSRRA